MTTTEVLEDLRSRILAGYPVLLLQTYEEDRWENELADLALEVERGLVTWSFANGPRPVISSQQDGLDPARFLDQLKEYPEDHLFLLKDLHLHLKRPDVIRKLRDLLPELVARRQTLLLMSPVDDLPVELLKDVTVLSLPLPGPDEVRRELVKVLAHDEFREFKLEAVGEDRLLQAVLGLTAIEARQAFAKVLRGETSVTEDVLARLVAEKRHLIQGSRLLEFFDLDEGSDAIGGLESLKEWIVERVSAFSSEARNQGIASPRGVLLAGVQGCGKSLSARVIARMLGFPLVRMDLGSLLESTRGGSEQNLREVLNLAETIAPAVLWIEEIDKAFSDMSEFAQSDATISRLLGRFLTWLQEHRAPVFVVATANQVASLPPELLRRGRFDEIFFVDLPNYHERMEILRIHLAKRGWKPEKFDIGELSSETEGYNGAELEQIVNSAIIESFARNRMPTQDDLLLARERTVPLSVTMEDEIFALREWARTRCRPATRDSRVIQVLEEERRRGELTEDAPKGTPKWAQLAEHGQLASAIVEFIREHDNVLWTMLLNALSKYVETQGEYGIVLRSDPKIAITLRVSREIADTMCDYVSGKRLYLHPVHIEDVPTEDRPQLPILESLPEDRVSHPVWFPTMLRLLPPEQGSGKLGSVARVRMGRAAGATQ